MWEEEGSSKTGGYLKITSFRLKKDTPQQLGNQAKVAGGQYMWERNPWVNSDIKTIQEVEAGVGWECQGQPRVLLTDMQGNKKGFHRYICSTRKTRKNMVPPLNGARELMTNYMRKDEVLNVSASVSIGKPSLWESQASQARRKVWELREDIPSEEENQMKEPLNKFDVQKSTGPMGCPHKYWWRQLMSLQGYPWLSMKG